MTPTFIFVFMKSGRITIHDIAKHLNLDSSTVSRALNDSPRVKAKTKEKIKKVAKELGYMPNVMAANLRTQSSKSIGVIVPWISRHFFSSAISGIEEEAFKEGFNVIICQSHDEYHREVSSAHTLFANRVEGILTSVAMDTDKYDHFERFIESGIPLVLFDRSPSEVRACRVVIDDFQAAYEMTEHLIQQGCKRIAHFSGPLHLNIYKDRFNGYKKALTDNGLTFDPKLEFNSRLIPDDGIKGIKYLLSNTNRPDALFSANDVAALSAMQYLHKKTSLSIPTDIAVSGFSNSPGATIISPSLTTVDQSGDEIGRIAAKRLVSEIKGEMRKKTRDIITVESKLIIRESTLIKVSHSNQKKTPFD